MNQNNLIKFKLQKIKSRLGDPLRYLGVIEKQDWSNIVPVFIISTGRTGTHFFSHFFNNNFNNVYAVHEPNIDIFDLNNSFLKNEVSYYRAGVMYKEFRKEIYNFLKKNSINTFIECNNNLSYLIPVLRKEYKNYKIIYIKRDGRDFVRSAYSKTTKGKWVGEVLTHSEKDPRNRLNPSFFKDDLYKEKWDKMDRFEKICWTWSRKDGIIFNEVKNDSNALIVKFEGLFIKKQSAEWDKILDFLELRDHMVITNPLSYIKEKKSNQTKSFTLPSWGKWTKEHQNQFLKIAGDHMSSLGYEIV